MVLTMLPPQSILFTLTSLPETDYAKKVKGHGPHLGFSAFVTVCDNVSDVCAQAYIQLLYVIKKPP